MQSNVSSGGASQEKMFPLFQGDKNKHGIIIISTVSLTKEYTWESGRLFKNIIRDKYFLPSQRFLSDYVPPLIDHDLRIDKEQFGVLTFLIYFDHFSFFSTNCLNIIFPFSNEFLAEKQKLYHRNFSFRNIILEVGILKTAEISQYLSKPKQLLNIFSLVSEFKHLI